MKYLFSLFVALLSSSHAHADSPGASEYVSIDCPKGDITLALSKDGTFMLELKHWDPKQNRHTHRESLTGKWRIAEKKLVLTGSVELRYLRELSAMTVGSHSGNIDSFKWESSSKPTFADTFSLVERKEVDDLFRRATPK